MHFLKGQFTQIEHFLGTKGDYFKVIKLWATQMKFCSPALYCFGGWNLGPNEIKHKLPAWLATTRGEWEIMFGALDFW